MEFEAVIKKYFPLVYREADFVEMTYAALGKLGFNVENTIASVCICRDEISQSLHDLVREAWGEVFNLSSLGGMFFAGQTGLIAVMNHSPKVDERERYVYYAMPHIAIDAEGRMGFCKRKGIIESSACGALCFFLSELIERKINLTIDDRDAEQSLLKRRLLKDIPYGHVPNLLEITHIAQMAVQADIEQAIAHVVNTGKSDYALITGIQIHGPPGNFIWPASFYAVVNDNRIEIETDSNELQRVE